MKRSYIQHVVIGQSLLLLTTSQAFALSNPCDALSKKNFAHCAYVATSAQAMTGKYIKIKESKAGEPSTTKIFCVAPSSHPLKSLPQTLWHNAQAAKQVTWQFSQCIDEDCSTSKLLLDDRFSVSGSKNTVEVNLDPNYGTNCKADNAQQLNDSALQMKIDDAVEMLQLIPVVLNSTASYVTQMSGIASEAATGTFSSSQLGFLNNEFQALKLAIDKAQRVNTLDGVKNVSAGTVTISMGEKSNSLQIPIPATDQKSLGISSLDVLTVADAQSAMVSLDTAINVIDQALSLQLNKK